jgi:transposase InsO family protein
VAGWDGSEPGTGDAIDHGLSPDRPGESGGLAAPAAAARRAGISAHRHGAVAIFPRFAVLEAILEQFPFVIRGFHSDNGSEFINYNLARLLGKLLIEQTKSRAHHCGDNGLVESKNGAIIRKHIGFGYIDAQHAEAMDQFHRQHLNLYVNFHRPCAVPKVITEANGKRRRVYQRWATPFELFREIPRCESYLRPPVTLAELDRFAQTQSDTESDLEMQRAKRKLLQTVRPRSA